MAQTESSAHQSELDSDLYITRRSARTCQPVNTSRVPSCEDQSSNTSPEKLYANRQERYLLWEFIKITISTEQGRRYPLCGAVDEGVWDRVERELENSLPGAKTYTRVHGPNFSKPVISGLASFPREGDPGQGPVPCACAQQTALEEGGMLDGAAGGRGRGPDRRIGRADEKHPHTAECDSFTKRKRSKSQKK